MFTLAAPAHAQLGLHLLGGAGSSTVLFEDEDSGHTGYKLGYQAGAGFTVPVTRGIGLRFDAQYVQKGVVLDASEPGVTIEADVDLAYFELAPSVTFGDEHVYAIGGPWFALKAACDVSVTAAGMSLEQECGEDTLDIKDTDFGVAGGLGMKVGSSSAPGPEERHRAERPDHHLTPGGNLPTMIVGTSSSSSSTQAASPSGPKASGMGGSSGARVPT